MLQRTDGSPAVKIADGAIMAMSSDKKSVLTVYPTSPMQLMLYPTGAGSSRRLDKGEFSVISSATFLGSAGKIVVCGNELKKSPRCYVGSIAGGTFRPFTPDGVRGAIASPDGQSIIASTADGYKQFSVSDGKSNSVPGLTPEDHVLRFSPDGKSLWVRRVLIQPVHIERVDMASGARTQL